ncbi:hypothetical protein VZT92_008118 [Zoarces viviparus]|uniref:Uncharacterized protein n=1 Tax=Zoarces viviparus TaxID=48416 RepID=A0AAW1FLK5_ZOAVI
MRSGIGSREELEKPGFIVSLVEWDISLLEGTPEAGNCPAVNWPQCGCGYSIGTLTIWKSVFLVRDRDGYGLKVDSVQMMCRWNFWVRRDGRCAKEQLWQNVAG